MKNLLKLVFMWTLSLMISLGIVYGAGKLITSLNQTAVKGDVITSDWVNAVNTKMSSNGEYVKGGLYGYCAGGCSYGATLIPPIQCIHNRQDPYGIGTCTCPSGFTRIPLEPVRGFTSPTSGVPMPTSFTAMTCMKN